jgi:hypothetical protein
MTTYIVQQLLNDWHDYKRFASQGQALSLYTDLELKRINGFGAKTKWRVIRRLDQTLTDH